MLFNSLEFFLFLPTVFVLYWLVFGRNLKLQNLFVLAASYIFYGWWDYRFLILIVLSTAVDYFAGLNIARREKRIQKRAWLGISLGFNLTLLGFFKYYNFFVASFIEAFQGIGYQLDIRTLQIILPVGISFYTFQTMSYTLDIYKGKLQPTRNFIAFSTFVAFFPQLVAGPIERATKLLPQILSPRRFDYQQAIKGLRLILWGLFKKIAIADALAPTVNDIFEHYQDYPSGILILGAVCFAFQIYGDFSGYTDIARGIAKLLGFELMLNFDYPYFSRSVAEFWRKWHISLSTWFRDYVYIPLGGSRVSAWKGVRNVFIVFLVSGFWHGANWTFLMWGGVHALLFVPFFVLGYNRVHMGPIVSENKWLPKWSTVLQIAFTFTVVTVAWVFFRADSIGIAFDYLRRIISGPMEFGKYLNPYDNLPLTKELVILGIFITTEYFLSTGKLNGVLNHSRGAILVDACLLVLILINIPVEKGLAFIYSQF